MTLDEIKEAFSILQAASIATKDKHLKLAADNTRRYIAKQIVKPYTYSPLEEVRYSQLALGIDEHGNVTAAQTRSEDF